VVGVTIEVSHFAQGRKVLSLTVCPACGYEFAEDEDRYHHLGDHDPEDFGLSPLGEIENGHKEPLFPDVEAHALDFEREPDVTAQDRRGCIEQ
jgi:hypothetical protein